MATEEDGLSWLFELDAETGGAERLLKTLDRLDKTIAGLDTKTHDVDKATRAAGEGHKKHAHDAEDLIGTIKNLTHQFTHMIETVAEWKAAEFLLELPKKIFEMGEEIVGVAAKAERTSKSFELLFGPEEGKENLEYLERIGRYTEFTQERLKKSMLDLGRMGFRGEGLDRALAAAHDMASFFDNPEEGISEAVSALGRVKQSGRVDRRSLRPLGINEQDYLGELAKRTGKSAESLKKAMEKGTVNAEDAIETLYTMIAKRTGKDLGGAAVDMSKSMSAMLTHLRETPERYFEKLKDSTGFAALKDQLGHIFDAIDPEGPNGAKIFGALESAFNGIAEKVASIDVASVLQKGIDVLQNMPFVLEAVGATIKDIGTYLHPLVTGFEAVAGAVDKVMNLVAPKAKDQDKLEFRMEHPEAFARSDKLQAELFRKRLFEKSGHGDEFVQDPSTIFKVGEEMGDAVEKGFRKKTRTHSPSDAFREIGKDLSDGLALGMGDADSVVAPMGRAASGGGQTISVQVSAPVSFVGNSERSGAEAAEEFAARLRAILPGELQSAFEQIQIGAGA